MSNDQNGPFGPPPGGGGWGPPAGAPPGPTQQQGYAPPQQQGYPPPQQQGYAPPQQQGYPPPQQQQYPMQPQQQGYPPQQQQQPGYPQQQQQQGYPMQQQGYPPQQQGYPMQHQPQYGHGPINIVVQNTANAMGGGGLVRTGNKTRMNAAILAFFVGGLGAHKFYLGRTGIGVLYLVFCWTMIPSGIAFIEGILLLMMSDHDFDLKYNSALAR